MSTAYTRLLQQAPLAILTVDQAGYVIACNDSACEFLARHRNELVGRPLLQWFASAQRHSARAEFAHSLAGKVARFPTRLVRGDGVLRDVLVHAIAQDGDSGDDRYLDVCLLDAGSQRLLHDVPAQLIDMLLGLPAQFLTLVDREGKIRYSNGIARTHWLNDGELLGEPFASLLPPIDAARAAAHTMLQAGLRGDSWTGTQMHVRADGSQMPVRLYAAPHHDNGSSSARGVLIVGRDISAEEDLRTRVIQHEKLASVGSVVAGVARELQQRLHKVESAAADARSEAVGALGQLLDQLLLFACDAALAREPQSMRVVAAEVIAAQGWSDQVVNNVPAGLPLVMIDYQHLRALLLQLLLNAREATHAQPGARIEVFAEHDRALVGLQVSNTARNGPPADNSIYEPFSTTKPGRFGLGLAIVRSLAQLYGGRVWHAWQNGTTTFTVALPTEAPTPVALRAGPLLVPRTRSVLVVDDDATMREICRKVLEKVGYTVLEAWSGRSAVAAISAGRPPDLMLADLKMKGGTGYWLLKELRRDLPEMLKRTVIITGDPATNAVEQLSAETGCPVLRKPLDFTMLLEVLDEISVRVLATNQR